MTITVRIEPIEYAALVVYRGTRQLSTRYADHLLRTNREAALYPVKADRVIQPRGHDAEVSRA
jgi:hypothetical protein